MTLPTAIGDTALAGARDASRVASGSVPARAPAGGDAKAREIDGAARAFEKLLVQRMLGDMRRAARDVDASNAMSNWEAMFDEEIAEIVTARGGLGFGDALSRSLGGTGNVAVVQPSAPSGLPASDVRALRDLVARAPEPVHEPPYDPSRDADAGASAGLAHVARPDAPSAFPRTAPREGAALQDGFIAPLRAHAERNARRLDVAPEAILAIAALETGWGRHRIVDERGGDSHNLFGIKAVGDARATAVAHRTTEFIGGAPRKVEASFARFDSPGEAVDGFADFVLENPRYAPALAVAPDAEAFLRELHRAGYATDPDYADKAIDLLHRVRERLHGAAATPTTEGSTP